MKMMLEVTMSEDESPNTQTEAQLASLSQNESFKVLKEISRGTMSTVYYCKGGYALKTMDEDANPDAIAIYQNDLQVLTDLGEHPYIVRLYDRASEAIIQGQNFSQRASNC